MKTIPTGIVIATLACLTAGWSIYLFYPSANSASTPVSTSAHSVTLPPLLKSPDLSASIQQITTLSEQDIWLAGLKEKAALNPAAALEDALHASNRFLREEAISQTLLGWLSVDSESAFEWALNLDDVQIRQTALTTIGYEVSRTHPDIASEVLANLSDDANTARLGAYIATQRSVRNPMEAYLWADHLPQGHLRESVFSGVLTTWADSNPGEAINLAITDLSAGETQECAVAHILARWTQQQPDSSANWVSQQIAPGSFKNELVNLLTSINQVSDNDAIPH